MRMSMGSDQVVKNDILYNSLVVDRDRQWGRGGVGMVRVLSKECVDITQACDRSAAASVRFEYGSKYSAVGGTTRNPPVEDGDCHVLNDDLRNLW
jgi:hypothetical protein